MHIADVNPHIRFAQEITYVLNHRCFHVKDCRIFYILGGSGSIWMQGKMLHLKENDLFYCCGGQTYTINAEDHLRFYSLNFDLSQRHSDCCTPFSPENLQNTTPTEPVDVCSITDSSFLNSFYLLENAVVFKNDIAAIVGEYDKQERYFRESCSATLKKLLIDLHKKNTESENNSADAVRRITEYLQLNFEKEIKNSVLAKMVGYHEYYLNRLFMRHTGMSMHKYALMLRIGEGKRLLLNTSLSVADIAARVGFNSVAHFSAYFKKETEASPLEYRRSFKHRI